MNRELRVARDKETVLGGGVYELTDNGFPRQPGDYQFPPYRLTMTYGKGEAEEVAARYIALCQQTCCWLAIDYNVFRRMVAAELRDQQIQTGRIFSFISVEKARIGTGLDDWITWVIDAGILWLIEAGCLEREDTNDETGYPCTIITPTHRFFPPIERYALTPVTG